MYLDQYNTVYKKSNPNIDKNLHISTTSCSNVNKALDLIVTIGEK